MAAVELDKISKIFPSATKGGASSAALREVSLSASDRELLVLVGPSGSGKTTLLRIVAGLESPSSGRVSIGGEDVTGVPPQARGVSMVFQEHSLYPHMTVRENLAFGMKLRKLAKSESAARVNQVAQALGLAGLLDRNPNALSGGERQRAALGRSMVLKPGVFLLDEPFSQLDAPLRWRMRRELAGLHRKLGATTIYVTHDQLEAMALAERLAVIKDGVIQQIGRPLELYRNPANAFVASFLGMPPMNLVQGTLEQRGPGLAFLANGSADLTFQVHANALASLAASKAERIIMGLRPEHLRLLPAPRSLAGGERSFPATIDRVETLGWETHVCLACGQHELIARAEADFHGGAGDQVHVAADMAQAHFFEGIGGQRLS